MAAYHISVRRCIQSTGDIRVLLLDEERKAVARVDALSIDHARLVAHDLMTLVRQRDPSGAFIFDTHIEPHSLAA
jgi:hypothetical protein